MIGVFLERARRVVYKSLDGEGSCAALFCRGTSASYRPCPAMLFFHGGAGIVAVSFSLALQALYYVERGVIGVLVEYRHGVSHRGPAPQSYQDGRAAVRYLRQQAGELNLDPARLIVVVPGPEATSPAPSPSVRRFPRRRPTSPPNRGRMALFPQHDL